MTDLLLILAGFVVGFIIGFSIAYKVVSRTMNKQSGGKIVFNRYSQGIDIYVEFPDEGTLESVSHRTYAVFEIEENVSH